MKWVRLPVTAGFLLVAAAAVVSISHCANESDCGTLDPETVRMKIGETVTFTDYGAGRMWSATGGGTFSPDVLDRINRTSTVQFTATGPPGTYYVFNGTGSCRQQSIVTIDPADEDMGGSPD